MKSLSSTTPREAAMERKLMGLRRKLKLWQHHNRELYRATKYYKELCEKQGKLEPVPDPYAATLAQVAPPLRAPQARSNPTPPPRQEQARTSSSWRTAEEQSRAARLARTWTLAATEPPQEAGLQGLQERLSALARRASLNRT